MRTKLLTQIILTLALLFGLGGFCGYAMSTRIHAPRPAFGQGKEWAARALERRKTEDFARLGATPEQQAVLGPIYDKLLSDLQGIQTEAAAKVAQAFRQHNTEVWNSLGPEQREIYRQSVRERLQKRKSLQP
jgi:hypothetical protein